MQLTRAEAMRERAYWMLKDILRNRHDCKMPPDLAWQFDYYGRRCGYTDEQGRRWVRY